MRLHHNPVMSLLPGAAGPTMRPFSRFEVSGRALARDTVPGSLKPQRFAHTRCN